MGWRRAGWGTTSAVTAMLAGSAGATPCTRFTPTLSESATAALAKPIATQLNAPDLHVLNAFRAGRWRMIYVDTRLLDEAVVFFPGDPATTRYVTEWGGAASPSEAPELRRWVAVNAPGIAPGLARCFAWFVTEGRK